MAATVFLQHDGNCTPFEQRLARGQLEIVPEALLFGFINKTGFLGG
jgi:hypothetical protein